jgi:hypothetical protein
LAPKQAEALHHVQQQQRWGSRSSRLLRWSTGCTHLPAGQLAAPWLLPPLQQQAPPSPLLSQLGSARAVCSLLLLLLLLQVRQTAPVLWLV